jgi:hypothetical protein
VKRLLALTLLSLAAACASRPPAETRPLYTKVGLASVSTAELAARFLPPADAATIERHWIEEAEYLARDRSWTIRFRARLNPVGEDICERVTYALTLFPTKRAKGDERKEMPAWADKPYRFSAFALDPGCADIPGRRFAIDAGAGDNRLEDSESMKILRSLAFVRAAAAAPEPLPFRLSCTNWASHYGFECPTDLRGALASLSLHRAMTVERDPFPNNCDTSERDPADAVEIGGPDDQLVWDVRLRRLGTDQAEVEMIRQFPRTRVLC